MKIRDIVTEAPIDTPLDKPATAVGKTAGKAAFGAGELAGKAAAKIGSIGGKSQDPTKVNYLKAIGKGIGASLKGQDLARDTKPDTTDPTSSLVDKIISGRPISSSAIQSMLDRLPNMKLAWTVDRSAVEQALNKSLKQEQLDFNDINALKALSKSLKKV